MAPDINPMKVDPRTKHGKHVFHCGGVVKYSELPLLDFVLRVNVTQSDHDIMENLKTMTLWVQIREMHEMCKVFNFAYHPDLLRHTTH